MTRHAVQSSGISVLKYDKAKKYLLVTYEDGQTFEHIGISEKTYREIVSSLQAAESMGKILRNRRHNGNQK
jgi:hypothetical protein